MYDTYFFILSSRGKQYGDIVEYAHSSSLNRRTFEVNMIR